jgi:hypothetical protein
MGGLFSKCDDFKTMAGKELKKMNCNGTIYLSDDGKTFNCSNIDLNHDFAFERLQKISKDLKDSRRCSGTTFLDTDGLYCSSVIDPPKIELDPIVTDAEEIENFENFNSQSKSKDFSFVLLLTLLVLFVFMYANRKHLCKMLK